MSADVTHGPDVYGAAPAEEAPDAALPERATRDESPELAADELTSDVEPIVEAADEPAAVAA